MQFNYDKLKDAIHYVCARNVEKNGAVDDVKLNKILWYADARAYMLRGQPITGAVYMRKPFGPVAKYNSKAVKQLIEEGAITDGKRPDEQTGAWRRVLDSTSPVNQKALAPTERDLLDEVFDHLNNRHSMEISDQSHGEIWMLARDREEIPLNTMFAERVIDLTSEEMEEARTGFG